MSDSGSSTCRSPSSLVVFAGPLFFVFSILAATPSVAASVAGVQVVADDGVRRNARIEVLDADGVAYVSLSRLVEQVGGNASALPAHARVDFAGHTARISVNRKEIESSLGSFSTEHPVLRERDEVLMALGDLAGFFEKAFRARLTVSVTDALSAPSVPLAPLDPFEIDHSQPIEIDVTAATKPAVRIVVLDPGHGGSDTGAVGPTGLQEKEVALAVAQQALRRLQDASSFRGVVTREGRDINWSDAARSNFADTKSSGDLFISIHTGAGYAPEAQGIELFIPAPVRSGWPIRSGSSAADPLERRRSERDFIADSRRLAESLAAALCESTGAKIRGIREVRCRVLDAVSMPGVLIEVGVLSNPAEETLLSTEEYREKIAAGIVKGIQNLVGDSGGARGLP